MKDRLVIGSRGSDLALWQAHFLQRSLRDIGVGSDILIIKTQGDQIQHISLEKLEGKGFFTKEIEDALIAGTIDVAVHSHKDLPTASTPGLTIAAVSYREDPSELLLIRKERADATLFWQLPYQAKVGTSSARRAVQLQFFRSDIQCADIRGNVPTRIQKLRDGHYDAILLAAAGVQRLQLPIDDLVALKIQPQHFIPAPAQGVLAYQCRDNDAQVLEILSKLHQQDVAATIAVERKVMQLFNGGCHMPLGVYCEEQHGELVAWATQTSDRSKEPRRLFMRSHDADTLAQQIFTTLQRHANRRILFTTDETSAASALRVIAAAGDHGFATSFVEIESLPFQFDGEGDWLFFTSKNGVREFFRVAVQIPKHFKIAAFGQETAKEIFATGAHVDFIGDGRVDEVSRQFEALGSGEHIVFPCALHARTELHNAIAVYARTTVLPVYLNAITSAPAQQVDIVACTSPMQAEGFLSANPGPRRERFVAIGDTTASYLKQQGIDPVYISPQPSILSMAELICGLM